VPCTEPEGPSEYRFAEVTRQLTTNIAVVSRFLERDIVCDGEQAGPGVVRILWVKKFSRQAVSNNFMPRKAVMTTSSIETLS
jgi:hypothetical protein